jgi:hypothetical protein
MQDRGAASATVRPYDDFHILIQGHEETKKTLDGKLTEFAAQHLRYIGLANAKQLGGVHLFHAARFHDRIDLEHQLRLYQVLFGIRHANVLEYIAASSFVSLVAHSFSSLAIRSASRSRCLVSSTSRRGVSRPVFDFF